MSPDKKTSPRILAGNWKMYKTRNEVTDFFATLGRKLQKSEVRSIVAPSPTLLETAVRAADGSGVQIFSQNCAYAKEGALTGEISPLQLKDIGVTGTIIGHSERRQHFGETNETCYKRTQTAIENGLEVIYCIGETHKERKANDTREVLIEQLKPVVQLRPAWGKFSSFMIAYEPVWAIGTGLNAGPEQIEEAHRWIAEILEGAGLPAYPVLYGGSVKPNNFKEIGQTARVSGGLVGGASLDAASYLQLHDCLL